MDVNRRLNNKLKKLYQGSIKLFNDLKSTDNENKRIQLEKQLDNTRNKIEDVLIDIIQTDKADKLGFYPELLDKNFNTKIYSKKEFNDYRAKMDKSSDICDKNLGSFSLSNAQMLVKNYISPHTPYNGLLLWWGVGIGKSCAAISIAEGFSNEINERFKRNKTIIITSGETLNGQWKRAIFDPIREDRKIDKSINVQCSGDNYTKIFNRKMKVKRLKGQKIDDKAKEALGNQLVQQNYKFFGYEKFANDYDKYEQQAIKLKPKNMTTEEAKILMIKDIFSNRVIIIDEAHNTNPQINRKSEKRFSPCITKILRYAENTKLILLSATPINNSPRDIIWLLNLLLLNDKRGTLDENAIFKDNGEFRPGMEEYFYKKATGYISYIRSENPISYPLRISPLKNLAIEKSGILKSISDTKLKYRCYYPKPLSVDGKIVSHDSDKTERNANIFNYLQLTENPMSVFQYTNYLLSINDKDDELVTFKKSIQDVSGRRGLNIVYPKSKSGKIDEFFGDVDGFKRCFKEQKKNYKYEYEYSDFCKGFLKPENIEKYSKKFSTVLNCIQNSNGIIFVHIPYVAEATVFSMMLEELGYNRHGSSFIKGMRNFLNTGVSANGSEYLLLTGETSKRLLNTGIINLNRETNINGEQIKVVIATDVAKEGLNFFNVREIHILSPWYHLNRLEQIIGRGMRNCSHKNLKPERRNVTIYYHTATIPSGFCSKLANTEKSPNDYSDRREWSWGSVKPITDALKKLLPSNKQVKKMKDEDVIKLLQYETFDEFLYWYAINKANTIAPISRKLKEMAFDCNLNRVANINTAEKFDAEKLPKTQMVETGQGVMFQQDLFDKPNEKMIYPQICDFMECDYKCSKIDKFKKNMDTYNLKYARNDIDSVKTYIKGLFSVGFVYSLSDIETYVQELNGTEIDKLYIYYALDEFVREGITIYDKFERPGYILYVPSGLESYYVFQPNEIDDPSITMNIRNKPLSIKDIRKNIINELDVELGEETVMEPTIDKGDDYIEIVSKLVESSLISKNKDYDDINLLELMESVYKIPKGTFVKDGKITNKKIEKMIYFYMYDSMNGEQLLDRLKKNQSFIKDYLKPITIDNIYFIPNIDDLTVKIYIFDEGEYREITPADPQYDMIMEDDNNIVEIINTIPKTVRFKKVNISKFGFKYIDVKHPRAKDQIPLIAYCYNNKGKVYIKETVLEQKLSKKQQLKGSICGSNRTKGKLSKMIRSLSTDIFDIKGKKLDKIEYKFNKTNMCEIIKFLSLYNRINKNLLHYKFSYELDPRNMKKNDPDNHILNITEI